MRKKIIAIAAFAVFCFTNIALAAEDPFADVPAKHWAYEAVNKLAKAGIVNGYGDGTFRGDRIMSRFEMAMVVGNAMTKADRADAANKALVDKLAAEFANELKTLGKRVERVERVEQRVEALEKNQPKLKIDGFAQYRTEYIKNPRNIPENLGLSPASTGGKATGKNASRTLLWLNVSNQFDGDTFFHGILAAESLGGKTGDVGLQVKEANITKRVSDQINLGFGRFFPTDMGLGTLAGAPYMDGAKFSFSPDNNVKFNCLVARFGDERTNPLGTISVNGTTINTIQFTSATYYMGEIKANLDKNTLVSVSALKDNQKGSIRNIYNSFAVGLEYKEIPHITLSNEYARNNAEGAKRLNGTFFAPGKAPVAYYIKAKYDGANPFRVGSAGFWVQYKKADPGMDTLGFANPFAWNSPLNWSTPAQGGMAENVKGFEYGFETTIAMRTIFKATYNSVKSVKFGPTDYASLMNNGKENQSFYTAQLTYLF